MLKVQKNEAAKKDELIEKITACIVKMRNICYGLAPAELNLPQGGQESADLLSMLNELCGQFEKRSAIPCKLNAENLESLFMQKERAAQIVRIIQEAFRNIEKHSYATEAQVLVRRQEADNASGKTLLMIFVIDDGRGCDLKEISKRKNARLHFGIPSMKERAKAIGAEISFRSSKDDGMQIKLTLCDEWSPTNCVSPTN